MFSPKATDMLLGIVTPQSVSQVCSLQKLQTPPPPGKGSLFLKTARALTWATPQAMSDVASDVAGSEIERGATRASISLGDDTVAHNNAIAALGCALSRQNPQIFCG